MLLKIVAAVFCFFFLAAEFIVAAVFCLTLLLSSSFVGCFFLWVSLLWPPIRGSLLCSFFLFEDLCIVCAFKDIHVCNHVKLQKNKFRYMVLFELILFQGLEGGGH